MATKKRAAEKVTMRLLVEDMLERSSLWLHEDMPFKLDWTAAGHPQALVIAGPNASGKSFVGDLLTSWARAHFEANRIDISIRTRTGSGGGDPMMQRMVFGLEADHSTGCVSASVVQRAMSNALTWAKNGNTIVLLDEPEIGLSEGFARALGELVGREVVNVCADKEAKKFVGVIVVTHSKPLVRGLRNGMGQEPMFCRMGGEMASIDAWLSSEEQFTVEDLQRLQEQGTAGFKTVLAIEKSLTQKSRPGTKNRRS